MSMSRAAAATRTAATRTSAASSSFQLIGAAWTRAFRCIWMLEELGIPYQILGGGNDDDNNNNHHDYDPGSDNVKRYNPSGKVPVLLEYDNNSNSSNSSSSNSNSNNDQQPSFILTESTAINTYLGDVFCFPQNNSGSSSNSSLVPIPGTRDRARYDSTISFISNELDSQALWAYRKHVAMGQHFGYVPEMPNIARAHFEKSNAMVAQQLLLVNTNTNTNSYTQQQGPGPYLMGQHFTAADILYIHCLDWAKGLKWHTSWPLHLTTYRKLCHDRPAYIRTKALRDEMQKKQQKQQQQQQQAKTKEEKTPNSRL